MAHNIINNFQHLKSSNQKECIMLQKYDDVEIERANALIYLLYSCNAFEKSISNPDSVSKLLNLILSIQQKFDEDLPLFKITDWIAKNIERLEKEEYISVSDSIDGILDLKEDIDFDID